MNFFPSRALALLLAASFSLAQAAPETQKTEKPLSREEAQKEMERRIESFGWTRSGKGQLGMVADITVPPGYRFTGKSGSRQMMEFTHNIPIESQVGVIAPENLQWWVLFAYNDVGYVKDTDKDKLDADAILKTFTEREKSSNEERTKRGLPKLFLDGWAVPPRYNETTHNLEWALKVRDESGNISINYLTKLLGRSGVMSVTLLVNPDEMQMALPAYQKLLSGFGYTVGKSYAEYRQGDKTAQYALTGLITAGAGVALLKSGWLAKFGLLFAKLGKAAYLLVLGGLAGLKRLFVWLFGRRSDPQP